MTNSPSTIFSISSMPEAVDEPQHQRTPEELGSPADNSISPSNFRKIIAAIFGIYIFVFLGCGAALVDREKMLTVVGLAMAPALALMAMIYAVGHVSGVHFNPAVTIAFAVARNLPLMHNSALCGVAIGGTLLFNVLVAGPITGASMNPAGSIGPAVVSGVYKNQWVYVVAPIFGATAAGLIYSLLRQPTPTAQHTGNAKTAYNDLYLHRKP